LLGGANLATLDYGIRIPLGFMYGIPITPLGHLAHAVLPLLFIAVLVAVFGRRSDPSAPWETPVDLGLALGCGVGATALSSGWMSRYFLFRYPLTASDFGQYCESVGALRDGSLSGWVKQRSVVAGWLPSMLADALGVVDALFVGALISHVLMGVGIFLWARAAHSRLAGVCAVLLTLTVAPLVHLSRMVTFYPETVAGCVMAAAGSMLALRYRNLPAVFFSALTIGFVLLLDVRGLLWALPMLGLTGLATLLVRGLWRKLVAAGVLGVSLFVSYQVGGVTNWEETPSLERQTAYYVDEAIRRYKHPEIAAGLNTEQQVADSRYVWGWTPPADIPRTLRSLWRLKAALPEGIADQPETAYGRRTHVVPWVLPAGIGLLVALWGARRRRWLALGFLGTLTPFVVALQGTAQMVGHSRYIANGVTMVPVLLGLGFAVVAQGALSEQDSPDRRPAISRSEMGGLVAILVFVLGLVPCWISPVATWRAPVSADIEPTNSLWHAAHSAQLPLDISPRCVAALQRDFADGMPVGSRFLRWEVEKSPTHTPTLEGE
jgi:hypothetical protein